MVEVEVVQVKLEVKSEVVWVEVVFVGVLGLLTE